jgi:hypothetical protein
VTTRHFDRRWSKVEFDRSTVCAANCASVADVETGPPTVTTPRFEDGAFMIDLEDYDRSHGGVERGGRHVDLVDGEIELILRCASLGPRRHLDRRLRELKLVRGGYRG